MTEIAMLNAMGSLEFEESLALQKQWGIRVLDLKDHIYGKSVIDLTEEEASRAKEEIDKRVMSIYCFSTTLFDDDIEKGEAHFAEHHLGKLKQTLAVAEILKPKVIRLIAARTSRRDQIAHMPVDLRLRHPWVIPLYREAIDRISEAGFHATIENECHQCMFSNPDEIIDFFTELDRASEVFFTYDVQNLWQMGTFPSMEVYERLKPLIGFYHVKGGQTGEAGSSLVWSASLADAAWPVAEMTRQVVKDRVSEVICLNPSHGKRKEGYDYRDITERDLNYLRQLIMEAN